MNRLLMNVRRIGSFVAAALVVAVAWAPASAILIVQDDLSDGDRLGSDGLEAAFLAVDSTVTVVNDAGGLNTGNAINVNSGAFTGVAAIFDVVSPYQSVTPLIGEGLEMRFRFRLLATDSGVFRFGILNNGGDQQTVDNDNSPTNNDSNTIGFGVEIGVSGGSSGRFISDENVTGAGNMLGGTGLTPIGGSFGAASITDTAAHEGVFRITRTATGYDLTASIDGVGMPSASVVTALDVFHQLGWISGDPDNDFRIDNVELDRNILRNGTFERGALITSGPATGAFNDFARNWTNGGGVGTVHTGLVPGSATAVYLRDAVSNSFSQAAITGPDFRFDADFAAEDGNGSDRSFNMLLSSKGAGQINLRVGTSGNIQIFNDSGGPAGWQTITGLGTIDFSLDADNNKDFTSIGDILSVWHLRLIGLDYGTANARYDILLYPLADPNDVRFVSGLTFWQGGAPTIVSRNGLDEVIFTTGFGSAANQRADFAIDNVSLVTYVPTPAALPAGLGLLALAAGRGRRRRR